MIASDEEACKTFGEEGDAGDRFITIWKGSAHVCPIISGPITYFYLSPICWDVSTETLCRSCAAELYRYLLRAIKRSVGCQRVGEEGCGYEERRFHFDQKSFVSPIVWMLSLCWLRSPFYGFMY